MLRFEGWILLRLQVKRGDTYSVGCGRPSYSEQVSKFRIDVSPFYLKKKEDPSFEM
jgi:hypothetical protein